MPTDNPIKLTEKYERNGWPSLKRPDLKPPDGWSLSLLISLEWIHTHALPQAGQTIAYIRDGESLSDVRNVQKPLLILHGLLDTIVPPESYEEWVEALKRHDKVFEYKTYGNEPHGFLRPKNLQDVYERMEQFLDWYLLPR